jgi:hypothetical protein
VVVSGTLEFMSTVSFLPVHHREKGFIGHMTEHWNH